MTTFSEDPRPDGPAKVLYLGDTGSGKTGSLCSLAAAGYKLRILDLDANIGVMKDYLQNKASPYLVPGANWPKPQGLLGRVEFETIKDRVGFVNKVALPQGDSWPLIGDKLTAWAPDKLGWDTILVVDSLSALAKAAFAYQLKMNGRLGKRPEQSDWYQTQELVERILLLLSSPTVQCHVVIICHIAYIERDGDKVERGYPQTIGSALSPRVGQNFGHMLMAKTTGVGPAAKRQILTNTTGIVDLKTPAPLRVKSAYDLTSGLAEYWKDLGYEAPK